MSGLLPSFTEHGVLPPGDYQLTFNQLRSSLLVVGPPERPDWDMPWRLTLVNMAEVLVEQLWEEGISEVYLDGSFVEDKAHPHDISGILGPLGYPLQFPEAFRRSRSEFREKGIIRIVQPSRRAGE